MKPVAFLLGAALSAVIALPLAAQETRSFTDDAGRTVEIPADPQRIASLHDFGFTVPLIELGVVPVGSQGRTTAEGVPFIRASDILTGIDYPNSDIAFLGNSPIDIEAVAEVDPDLIIIYAGWETGPIENYELIAPTIVLDYRVRGAFGMYEALAEIVNAQDQLEILETRYANQIAQIRRLIETEDITVNHVVAGSSGIAAWHTYGSLGRVLRDAGFKHPARVDAIPENLSETFSPEAIQELDADFIFVTFGTYTLETPADQKARFEELLPGFCEHLHACRNNQMIYISREEAATASYYALGLMAQTVLSNIGGRAFVPMDR